MSRRLILPTALAILAGALLSGCQAVLEADQMSVQRPEMVAGRAVPDAR